MQHNRGRGDEGFTLIELLVVIVILGTLAAVVVFAVGSLSDRGTEAACRSDVKTVEVAMEAYNSQQGVYPAALTDLVGPGNFLKTAPRTDKGYTITVGNGDGVVSVTPADCAGL